MAQGEEGMTFEVLCPDCNQTRTLNGITNRAYKPRNAEGQYVIPCQKCNSSKRRWRNLGEDDD